jgi:hypothetical protein
MRESPGLRVRLSGRVGKTWRSSAASVVAHNLLKVSAARRVSVVQVLEEQHAVLVAQQQPPGGSPEAGASSPPALERSLAAKRVKPNQIFRPNKVHDSRARGVSPAFGSGKSGMGSGSATHNKFKSRIDMLAKSVGGAGGNMIKDTGVPGLKSFLPGKPKVPTMEEIQEMKEEERRKKEEREEEARKRRDELIKKKADEQREKREERIRRVQEARQQNENQRENRIRTNLAKENEEKLAALKKREERQKEEAEKKRKEAELRMRQAEEKRQKEEEERRAKAEQEARARDEEKARREEEEAEERKRRQEQQRREEKLRQQERQRQEEARILREREELRRLKEREAPEKPKENMNSTYPKPGNTTVTLEKPMDTTVTLEKTSNDTTSQMNNTQSYDMTPARHELPPIPPRARMTTDWMTSTRKRTRTTTRTPRRRFRSGLKDPTCGQLSSSSPTCRPTWTSSSRFQRCPTSRSCLPRSARGSTSAQAVPAGRRHLPHSSTTLRPLLLSHLKESEWCKKNISTQSILYPIILQSYHTFVLNLFCSFNCNYIGTVPI